VTSVDGCSGVFAIARLSISATSSKSLQKPWMPKILASLTSLLKRIRVFSVSANARL
jgi:hypothetical protein